MVNFNGAAKGRSPDAIARAAASIGVEEAALGAILDVETAGKGFDASGRPRALFEPHKFFAALKDSPEALQRAITEGLAYPVQGTKPYPKDSYPRITAAMAINTDAALRSTSWGLPQIMGSNCALAGYGSAQEMVEAFCDSEDTQIAAVAAFLKGAGIVSALKAKNWKTVALLYNGKGYAKNAYDTKLAAAYRKRSGAPAPAVAKPTPAPAAPVAVAPVALSADAVRNVQQRLKDLGYTEVGKVDGLMGARTSAAILAFRNDNGLPLTPGVDDKLASALLTAGPRPVAASRLAVGIADLKPTSTIVQLSSANKLMAAVIGVPGVAWAGLNGVLDNFSEAVDRLKPVQAFVSDVPSWVWGLAAASIAAGIWWNAYKTQVARVDMHKNGEVG